MVSHASLGPGWGDSESKSSFLEPWVGVVYTPQTPDPGLHLSSC